MGYGSASNKKNEQIYNRAIERAKRHDFAEAIADYTAVIDDEATAQNMRAMALVNRAKAYSAIKSHEKAHADLAAALAMPQAPAAVKDAAKEKLKRMKRLLKQPE